MMGKVKDAARRRSIVTEAVSLVVSKIGSR